MNATRNSTSWATLLAERAQRCPDRLALGFVEGRHANLSPLTYAELDNWARAIASVLRESCHPRARVIIALPSSLAYVAGFFGSLYAQCIPVTAYAPQSRRNLGRIAAIAQDCQSEIILTDQRTVALLGEDEAAHVQGSRVIDVHADIDRDETSARPSEAAGGSDVAYLQYTSGSTATPKGVMVTHENLFNNCEILREGMGFCADSVIASWLPLHHDMGLIGKILSSVYFCAPCYFMAPAEFVRWPHLWLNIISRYRGTITGSPNFGYELCVTRISEEQAKELDLSSLRVAWNGAEMIRTATLDRFYERFKSVGLEKGALHPCYGLAEATLLVTAEAIDHEPVTKEVARGPLADGHAVTAVGDDDERTRLPSVGRPLGDTVLRIVDPNTGRECRPGGVGEVWLHNGSIASGYWNRPDDTEQTFGARTAGNDGARYLRTGDLGFVEGQRLYFVGRMKDILVINGQNIYPEDLEITIEATVADIRSRGCVVVGLDHADGTTLAHAICELRRPAALGDEDFKDLARRITSSLQAEHQYCVDYVHFCGPKSISKTSSGKLQRKATGRALVNDEISAHYTAALTAEARQRGAHELWAASGRVSGDRSEHTLVQRVIAELARVAGREVASIDPNERISEQGLSSLQVHDMLSALEESTGRELTYESLHRGDPRVEEIAYRLGAHESTAARGRPRMNQQSGHRGAEHMPAPRQSGSLKPAPRTATKHMQRHGRERHRFERFINPEFGRKLAQLMLDKEFVRGEGCHLYDRNGRRYLDFLSQYGALPFGHNPPDLWETVYRHAAAAAPSFVQPSMLGPAGELAERLVAKAPAGIEHVSFCNSGAEAIEAAIKLARSTTGRRRVLATVYGFHGKTLGALSATGRHKYRRYFGVDGPDYQHVPFDDVDAARKELASREYAALIVEPVQGEAGVIVPQSDYLKQLERLCRETDTLLVVDEVQTGLGRTGAFLASEEAGVQPDVIALAKALGGGIVPIGACLIRGDQYNEEFGLKHTSTFGGNGLACTVALKVLDKLEADDGALLEHVTDNGARLKRGLESLQAKYPELVYDVRGIGHMLGMHLSIDRYDFGSGLLASVAEEEFVTSLLMSYLLNREGVRVGFTLNRGNVLRVQPPLTAEWQECEEFLAALDRTLAVLESRSIAALTEHIVGATPGSSYQGTVTRENFMRPVQEGVSARFGFVLHPLTPQTYVDFDDSLASFDRAQLEHLGQVFGDNFDPFLGGECTLVSDQGVTATGEFWVVPRMARELAGMPASQAIDEIQEGVDEAVEAGAQYIGLGAYTSMVTGGGTLLRCPETVTVTTGNAFTGLAAALSVPRALRALGRNAANETLAIVGATGSVGRGIALALGAIAGRLILIGNPERPEAAMKRLEQIAVELIEQSDHLADSLWQQRGPLIGAVRSLRSEGTPTADCVAELRSHGLIELTTSWNEHLPRADTVVTATSMPDAALMPEHLKQGALVCDVSRPCNVSSRVREERADVQVYDGGVLWLPGRRPLGMHLDLPRGRCYACMAEVMLMALENEPRMAHLGSDVEVSSFPKYEWLARKHGFEICLLWHAKEDGAKDEDRTIYPASAG